jgi:hypothetical protein
MVLISAKRIVAEQGFPVDCSIGSGADIAWIYMTL